MMEQREGSVVTNNVREAEGFGSRTFFLRPMRNGKCKENS